MTRRFSTILLLLVSFAAGLLLANRIRESMETGAQAQAPSANRPTIAAPVAVTSSAGTLTDFSRIAERIIPAVVNISSQQVVRRQVPIDPFFGSLCLSSKIRTRRLLPAERSVCLMVQSPSTGA